MKKLFLILFLLIGFAFAKAQKTKFYYYPSSNVYYNTASGKYIYSNSGKWTTVNTLPARLSVAKTPRVIVYHASPEVWVDNSNHKTKYKTVNMKPVPPGQLKAKKRIRH
jgi:hypothetical protein